jgi:hypothetical protein
MTNWREEMKAKWALTQLNEGAINGGDRRLFSERQSRKMWSDEDGPRLAADRLQFRLSGFAFHPGSEQTIILMLTDFVAPPPERRNVFSHE